MKTIKILNTFAIGLPIILLLIGFINGGFIIYAMISTMVTGFIQIILSIVLFLILYKRTKISYYLIAVVIYFAPFYFLEKTAFINVAILFFAIMAILLCIYISIIVYEN